MNSDNKHQLHSGLNPCPFVCMCLTRQIGDKHPVDSDDQIL